MRKLYYLSRKTPGKGAKQFRSMNRSFVHRPTKAIEADHPENRIRVEGDHRFVIRRSLDGEASGTVGLHEQDVVGLLERWDPRRVNPGELFILDQFPGSEDGDGTRNRGVKADLYFRSRGIRDGRERPGSANGESKRTLSKRLCSFPFLGPEHGWWW